MAQTPQCLALLGQVIFSLGFYYWITPLLGEDYSTLGLLLGESRTWLVARQHGLLSKAHYEGVSSNHKPTNPSKWVFVPDHRRMLLHRLCPAALAGGAKFCSELYCFSQNVWSFKAQIYGPFLTQQVWNMKVMNMILWKVTDCHFCNYKKLRLPIEELEMQFLQMDAWPSKELSFLNDFWSILLMSTNVMFPSKTDLKPADDTVVRGVLYMQAKGLTGASIDDLLPVKHTGHLKVPPMPSKLCSIRWHWSLAGESNVWLQSLHSWFSPSSVEEIKGKVKFATALTKEQVQHQLCTEETSS